MLCCWPHMHIQAQNTHTYTHTHFDTCHARSPQHHSHQAFTSISQRHTHTCEHDLLSGTSHLHSVPLPLTEFLFVCVSVSMYVCVSAEGWVGGWGGGGVIRPRGVLWSCLLSFDADSRIYGLILSLASSACPSHLHAGQPECVCFRLVFVRVVHTDWCSPSAQHPSPTPALCLTLASGWLLSWPFTFVTGWNVTSPPKLDVRPIIWCPSWL